MLELQNVTLRLKKNDRVLIDDFSFTLQSRDKAVIIGEEGDGKSTLLKWIADPDAVGGYCECAGSAVKKGVCVYLPQFTPRDVAEKTVAEVFEGTKIYPHTKLLRGLGIAPEKLADSQRFGSLSGGEQVKLRLIRLLMDEPDILLLDEPTNDLDIETLVWLERFLQQDSRPVLYVSHDETLIERTANVIIHLEQLQGKTKSRVSVIRGPYRDYLADRESRFAHQAQVARKQREDHARQMEKFRRIRDSVDRAQETISRADPAGGRLLKKKMHAVQSMGRRFEREQANFTEFPESEDAILASFDEAVTLPAGKTVLELPDTRLEIGGRLLAENVRLTVRGGEHIGITGRNGAGKSTLLRLIREKLNDRKDLNVGYMPQNYAELLDPDRSPVDFLAPDGKKEAVTRARTYLGSMRFTRPEMTGKIGELSGGQQAKILLLGMVLSGVNVLLLDEPTRNFSPLSGPVVRAALAGFGGTIICVSHDRKFLREVCGGILELTEAGLVSLDPDELG
ncbi:MAG: ABC-F family ATP-binding cassette domain-containing protein [Clostridia bacterium]|nr:ABC-F family ATP-binding cassette domain-containing protein [Clostridia bacterium]